jgi:hypothetical protein
MTTPKTNEVRRGLEYRGQPVDVIEMAAAVLMIFFLTYALGCALLAKTGMTEEEVGRLAVLIMPGFIIMVMVARYAAAAFNAIFNLILSVNTHLLRHKGKQK